MNINMKCGRPTRRGSPCRHQVVQVYRMPPRENYVAEACRMHLAPDEEARFARERGVDQELFDRYMATPPACHSWAVVDIEDSGEYPQCSPFELEVDLRRAIHLNGQLSRWHAGRCAICGRPGSDVDDHCHRSGLRRGYLCHGCNTQEGLYQTERFRLYRLRPPAVIIGVTSQYVGYGYPDGADPLPWVEKMLGPQPPSYSREAVEYLAAAAALEEPRGDIWADAPRLL